MKVAIPRERQEGEARVAATPDSVTKMVAKGLDVWIEAGAGDSAYFGDAAYREAGAKIAADESELYQGADVVLKVSPPGDDEIAKLPEGVTLLSFMQLGRHPQLPEKLAAKRAVGIALELLPRISRAQSMDALSSQASLAGYKAVLLGADLLARVMPMQMTAAGTLVPAKVFVLGAGVAGLQSIATAKRLGAVVEAFDVRRAVKDEIESLGAKFVQLELEAAEGQGGYAAAQSEEYLARQREMLTTHIAASDLVITTASIPLGKAPTLITAAMAESMKPGAVIVDLAAETGGNCELTKPGEEFVHNGVTIVGFTNLASRMATHASQTYARNLFNLLELMVSEGELKLDFEDEIIRTTCVTKDGEVLWKPRS